MPRSRAVRLVAFPDLIVRPTGTGVVLANLAHRTSLEASRDVLEVLKFFRRPRSRAEFEAAYDLDRAVLDALLREAVLVDASELALVRHGLLDRAPATFGRPTALVDLPRRPARRAGRTFAVVGAPVDQGSTADVGPRAGPAAIRAALAPYAPDDDGALAPAFYDIDARRRYRTAGRRVLDVGDVIRAPREGLDAIGAKLQHVVARLLAAGATPLVLGGDHSVSLFAIRAVVDHFGPVGVLHFDAHHDLSPGESGVDHANVFRHVLASERVRVLRQVGVRTLEAPAPVLVARRDRRLSWVTAREVLAMRSPAAALRGLPRGLPYYLTFDVDCLDPSVAPETGSPVAGGLALHHALAIVERACRSLRVVAADVVEVCGAASARNGAAAAAARVAMQVLLGDAPSARLAPTYFTG